MNDILYYLRRFIVVLWVAGIHLLGLLGVLVFVDLFQPPDLPDVRPCPTLLREKILRSDCLDFPGDESLKWAACRGALGLLDGVCPEVSAWVCERHAAGKLIWDGPSEKTIAWYHPPTGRLGVNDGFFWYDHARRASIFAHEFRHSRQKLLRHVEWALAIRLGLQREDLVEEEARAFERRVLDAIKHGE